MVVVVEVNEVCFTHIVYNGSSVPAEYGWGTHRSKNGRYEF
jgi:hypothetical protein